MRLNNESILYFVTQQVWVLYYVVLCHNNYNDKSYYKEY